MSTSAVRLEDASVSVSRVTWQSLDVDRVRNQEAEDVSWPSVVEQRAAVAEHEAADRGFAEGERAGQAAARMRAEALRTRLSATIDEITALRAGMLNASEHDVVRLAVAVAERIVRREVNVDHALLLKMAKAAARKLGDHSVVTISMHPDDVLAITSRRNGAPEAGPIKLEASDSLLPGACVVQSSIGTIDVGVEAQIREVLRGLLGDALDQSPDANADEAGGHN